MDIQSFTKFSTAKTGKSADVKNNRQSLQADGEEPLLDKNDFAKILVSVDASDSGLVLQPAESLVMPGASDAPRVPDVLPVLPPILFNATVALNRVDGGVENLMVSLDSHVPVQTVKGSSVNSLLSEAPSVAASFPTKTSTLAAPPIAPAVPLLDVRGGAPQAQMMTLSPISLRLDSNLAPTEVKAYVPASVGSSVPLKIEGFEVLTLDVVSSHSVPENPLPLKKDVVQELGKIAATPIAPAVLVLDVRGGAPQAQMMTLSPISPRLETNLAPTEVKAYVPASVGRTGLKPSSGKFTELESSVSPRAEFSVRSDATRKNEVLLDILALGDGLVVQDGPLLAVKQVAYAFQRETDPVHSQNTTDLQSSRVAPTETTSVPEKNSAWVAIGVQNVALTLDGLGDESVAVKISLSGLDTSIDIRTDHVVLRQMIEGSVQLMREQLSNDGLTLSTLSVGTSGQDQSMGQSAGKESQGRPHVAALSGHGSGRSSESLNPSSNQKSPPQPKRGGGLSVFA